MELEKLNDIIESEKPYRIKQVQKALYSDLVSSWSEVTVLPLPLRQKLQDEVPIKFDFDFVQSLEKNTFKAILKMHDGLNVEAVLLMHKGKRNTVCVSCQAGCPMNCIFCRTAKLGFKRNLATDEIAEQVMFFAYYLKKMEQKVTNIVFMGMGEPFLNYDNVIGAVRLFNDKSMFNIGARKISISTCGIPGMIEKFSGENLQVNLAVSLNAPNNALRAQLMPFSKKYPIAKVISAVKKYTEKTGRRVMFEYVMIDGLNDGLYLAQELAGLLKGMLCFVNLIPFNGKLKMKPPSTKKIIEFKMALEREHIAVTQRYDFGNDINAACGQLVYSSGQGGL
jgi:23S rRNA (adenine2503-C2)-methyltransferase